MVNNYPAAKLFATSDQCAQCGKKKKKQKCWAVLNSSSSVRFCRIMEIAHNRAIWGLQTQASIADETGASRPALRITYVVPLGAAKNELH